MGLALIFGVMRIVNFAHGAFLMVGMYATYLLFNRFGITPYAGFLAAAALLLTLGISQILSGGAQLVFGADYHSAHVPLLDVHVRLGGHITLNAASLLS